MDCRKSELYVFLSLFQCVGQGSYNRYSSHRQQTFKTPVNVYMLDNKGWAAPPPKTLDSTPHPRTPNACCGNSRHAHRHVSPAFSSSPKLSWMLLSLNNNTWHTHIVSKKRESLIYFYYQNICSWLQYHNLRDFMTPKIETSYQFNPSFRLLICSQSTRLRKLPTNAPINVKLLGGGGRT